MFCFGIQFKKTYIANMENINQTLETLKRKLHEIVNKIECLDNERIILLRKVQELTLQIETTKAMTNISLEMDEDDLLLQSEMYKLIDSE